jgi:hypothetical protein
MKLLSVLQARVVALLPLEELNPHGELIAPNATKLLIDKCGFLVYPQRVEDYLEPDKGIKYEVGAWDGQVIQQLLLFPSGIALDTNTSTSDSEKILTEMLVWAKEALKINYEPSMIKSKAYLSQVTFTCEKPLNALNPVLANIADKITKSVAGSIGFMFHYEANSIGFGYDTAHVKSNASRFVIERRADTSYSENKYFSSAPLPTDEHLSLLNEYEAALKP